MATKILIGKDTRLCIKENGSYVNMAGARNIGYPSATPDELDITQYGVAGDFDSFQAGMISAGEFTVEMQYLASEYDKYLTLMFNKTLNEFLIAFKTETGYKEYTFNAYISQMPITCVVTEIMTYEITLQLTGEITKHTGTSLVPTVLPTLQYGIIGKGTKVELSTDGTNYKSVKFAYECNGPDFALSYEDVTSFETVGMVKEQLPMTFSAGNFAVTAIAADGYGTNELGYDELLTFVTNQTLLYFRITYPSTEKWLGRAYLMDLTRDLNIKGKQGISFNLRITEKPTLTGVTIVDLLDQDVLDVIDLISNLPMPDDITDVNYTTYIADTTTAYQDYKALTNNQKNQISYILIYKLNQVMEVLDAFYFDDNSAHIDWDA
jgi:hypothetical protein